MTGKLEVHDMRVCPEDRIQLNQARLDTPQSSLAVSLLSGYIIEMFACVKLSMARLEVWSST